MLSRAFPSTKIISRAFGTRVPSIRTHPWMHMSRLPVSSQFIANSMRLYTETHTSEEIRIHKKLVDALETEEVRVQDVSGGCGSMYAIHVTSPKFNNLTTIKQHQLVNEILKEDIPKWHGLQLRTKKEKSKQ